MESEGILHLIRTYLTQEFGSGVGSYAMKQEDGSFAYDARGAATFLISNLYEGELSNPHFHLFVDEATFYYNNVNGTSFTSTEFLSLSVQPGGQNLILNFTDWVEGIYNFENGSMRPASEFGYTPEIAESLVYGAGADVWQKRFSAVSDLSEIARGSQSGIVHTGAALGLARSLNEALAALPETLHFDGNGNFHVLHGGVEVAAITPEVLTQSLEDGANFPQALLDTLDPEELSAIQNFGTLINQASNALDLPHTYTISTVANSSLSR